MATVGEVVAQLIGAIQSLDKALVTSERARSDVQQARGNLMQALDGAAHAEARQAVTEIELAGAKLEKLARLFAGASQRIAGYVDAIAPGAGPSRASGEDAALSGEDLVRDTVLRAESRSTVDGFLRKMARNIENVQSKGQDVTKIVESAIKDIKQPTGPGGGRTTTEVPAPAAPVKIEASDAVGNMLVVGVALGIAAQRSGVAVRKGIARMRKRGRSGESERSDPGDGS